MVGVVKGLRWIVEARSLSKHLHKATVMKSLEQSYILQA